MDYVSYLDNVKQMIKDLKAMCTGLGLANTGDEYKIISELFTYKFLNDKVQKEYEENHEEGESYAEYIEFVDSATAKIPENCTIEYLWSIQSNERINEILDTALVTISEENADVYSVATDNDNRKPLFEPLSSYIRDPKKEYELAVRSLNILHEYQFDGIYDKGWDFFSSIFEFLIGDYNKDSGKYAEYFTPVAAGTIMAKILYNNTPVDRVEIYDPSAGSGTLLLCLANEIGVSNCTIYSQDISQKSTQFLRTNLILNKLAQSLHNVIEGNTMTHPFHRDGDNLKKFDFVVSNPPFKMDFSADVEVMNADKYNRFFAGEFKVPAKKKEGMEIYLAFLQHILASLKDDGKAAMVVPTGFVTAQTGAGFKIRKKMVEENWIRGAIALPSGIFATTGTNVSLLFIDKSRTKNDKTIFLMDASGLGKKQKVDGIQRTILSERDTEKIVDFFLELKEESDFTINVELEEVKRKRYSFLAGQYFEVKVEYTKLTQEEFNEKMCEFSTNLSELFKRGKILESSIQSKLGDLHYE